MIRKLIEIGIILAILGFLAFSICWGISPAITSLNSGQVSPLFEARDDVRKYSSACRKVENMLVKTAGSATKRPGTKYIAGTDFTYADSTAVSYLQFDGSTGYVDTGLQADVLFGNPIAISNGGGISFSCWGLTSTTGKLFSWDGADSHLLLERSELERFTVFLKSTGVEEVVFTTDEIPNLDNGLWHYYVLTITKVSASTVSLKLYNNNELVISTDVFTFDLASSFQDFIDSTTTAKIGRRDTGGYYWYGGIDDFRIYASVLTQSQITAIFNNGIGTEYPDGIADANFALNMDEGTGTTVTDAVGGVLQGTLIDGVTWAEGGVPFDSNTIMNPGKVRLITFEYSVEDCYVLEMGNQSMRFFRNDGE